MRGRGMRAKRKSIEMPINLVLISGTYASGTAATSVTSSRSFNRASKISKKSSRWTCLGATHSVSISEPGPCTPSR